MAKKSSGKTYTSQGKHRAVKKSLSTEIKRAQPDGTKVINQQRAWLAGKNPTITIENPNSNETNKRFIRVSSNVLWGSPKERLKKIQAFN